MHNMTPTEKQLYTLLHIMLNLQQKSLSFAVVQKGVYRHFENLLKLCALFDLESCAKGAQHHNNQKTSLKACKHLAKLQKS